MSIVDIYKNKKMTAATTANSSIFLKKANKSSATVRTKKSVTNDTRKNRSFSLGSKIQSATLSLVASVSRKRPAANKKTAKKIIVEPSLSTSLTTLSTEDRPNRIKCTTRPLSQFFFPIKQKEDDAEEDNEDDFLMKNTSYIENGLYRQQQQEYHPQQQQTKRRQFKRMSLGVDFDRQQKQTSSSTCSENGTYSNSSSRSSSLKTIRTSYIEDELANELTIQSDITLSSYTSQIATKEHQCLSRSFSYAKEKRFSGVARARTVLGFDSHKSRESRAVGVWRNTVSQLLYESGTIWTDKVILEEGTHQDLYKIMAHPALASEATLESQRFVRHSSPKNLSMVKFILNELSETERSYNQLLKLIQDRYMKPMIAASQSKDPLVKSTDILFLFSHLPELVELSDKLLDQFQSTNKIGQVFRSMESYLVVFLKYAMHYRANIKTIRKACNNVLFVKINQESLARRDTNRLGMSDYLIAPIQRIPRYCLLLKDLQKYTHHSESHCADLDYALKILTGLAVAMDHVQSNNKSASLQPRTSLKTL